MTAENWLPIPVAPKYEINQRGDVRNVRTGKIIKPFAPKGHPQDKRFRLFVGKSRWAKHFHQTALLWLVHGVIPKRETYSRIAVPVIVSCGGERYYFDSSRQAAQFIARREHYSAEYVGHLFAQRREEIFSWKINYQR